MSELDALAKRQAAWSNGRGRMLAVTGIVLGAAAGLAIGSMTASWWAGVMALASVVYLVARAFPDVMREGDLWSRSVYFLVLPVTAWVVAIAVWSVFGQWWPGVLGGAAAGIVVQRAAGRYLMPKLASEEEAHSWEAIPHDEFEVPAPPEELLPGGGWRD